MTKLTTESLEKFVNDIKTDGMCDITDHQVESALIQLLAYEQAAEYPAARITWDGSEFSVSNVSEDFLYGGTAVYLAPVLPKQPELIGMKVSIDTGSDNIGHRLFGEIVGTSESNGVPVLCIEVTENNVDVAAPAQPVSEPYKLPDGWVMVPQQIFLDASDIESICSQCGDGHKSGYGDFTDGLLWVGDIQCDNGTIMHGMHISSSDYQEEGGLTLAEFKAPAQESE